MNDIQLIFPAVHLPFALYFPQLFPFSVGHTSPLRHSARLLNQLFLPPLFQLELLLRLLRRRRGWRWRWRSPPIEMQWCNLGKCSFRRFEERGIGHPSIRGSRFSGEWRTRQGIRSPNQFSHGELFRLRSYGIL
jgi:hypothetical protein